MYVYVHGEHNKGGPAEVIYVPTKSDSFKDS